jgi:hypothetical protein
LLAGLELLEQNHFGFIQFLKKENDNLCKSNCSSQAENIDSGMFNSKY